MNTDIEIRANVAKEIRDIINKKDISFTELGRRVGDPPQAIHRSLNGKSRITSHTIKKYLIGLEYTEEEATELMKKWFIEKINK